MNRLAMIAALGFAATALPASGVLAQPAPPDSPGQAFSLPFGSVPAEIHGVSCKAELGDSNFAPSLRCLATDPLKQPSIYVSVADWRSRPTRAELVAHMREAFHERPMFNVIREEDFAPPGDPDAVGFRGLYQTELGNRYVWAVLSKGKLIRVVATVFAPTDFGAMTSDIESKIFGVPAWSATAEKDK